jgi:hypothetical protein
MDFFDWIAREGGIVLSWWALVTLAGWAIFPLLVRLLPGLPDRGYTLARAAGLLLVGFVFWLLACLGLLRNTPGGIILSWGIVLVLSLFMFFRNREAFEWRAWWRENRTAIITALYCVADWLGDLSRFYARSQTHRETHGNGVSQWGDAQRNVPAERPLDGWLRD